MTPEKPRRLGRGLEALIPSSQPVAPTESDVQRIPLSRIRANPFQPRKLFDRAELAELEASLKASGLLQPITVRKRGDAYELIAGERRLRAATNLGWSEISAIARDFDDRTMLVLALVENLQRADLNALEEARGYRKLVDDFHLTQQQIADAVGKDRTTIANLLRVLALPDTVQAMVEQRKLSAGHARALLGLSAKDAILELANIAAAEGWSVRQLEQRVRERASEPDTRGQPSSRNAKAGSAKPIGAVLKALEDELRRYLQTDVKIQSSADTKGKIELSFYSADDLERLLDLILRDTRSRD